MSAESKWMRRLERGLGEVAVHSFRRPVVALTVAALLTGLGVLGAKDLPLVADLEKLLPKSFASVRDLEPVKEYFGGIGYIVLVGMDAEPEQLRRFADDWVPKLEKLEGIRHVDYKRPVRWLEDHQLYRLTTEDLREVDNRIKAAVKCEKKKLNPMYVRLDEEDCPSLDFSDIEAKYGVRSDQRLAGSGEEYYLDREKRMVVLLAKPVATSTDLRFSEDLVKRVEAQIEQHREELKKYGPNFHIGLTGTFKYKVDQQRQIVGDMARASALALLILLLYLAFHFRSLLAVAFTVVPVFCGLAWTYGITSITFGSLNVLTGFLGAILGGLGFEHGIHLIGRYGVLRAQGRSAEESTREAFLHTGASALVSSIIAACTFAAIAYSEFRAFREFGVMAAVGMLVVVAAYFLILPACLGLAARRGWKPAGVVAGAKSELARLLPGQYRSVALLVGVALALFVWKVPGIRFDYDFHSLEDSSLPSFKLDQETNRILGYSMEPVVILTDDAESEKGLVKALKERRSRQGRKPTIDFVASLGELVPEHQAEKHEVIKDIAATVEPLKPERFDDASKRTRLEKIQRLVKVPPFVREDIPISLRRQFEGVGYSKKSGFVLIFPNIKLSDGQAVRQFAHDVRGIDLAGGKSFSAAGETMVLADVLEMVTREAKPILAVSFFAALLLMWITIGSLRLALLCMSPTVLSLLGLVGLMSIAGIPFNYLNIIVVPVLIGTTVDAGVHLVTRLSDAHGEFPSVFGETGRAIVGGLITSGVGFGALLIADHPGLNSIGRLANLGFALNLAVMLLGFPALILWLQRGFVGKTLREEDLEESPAPDPVPAGQPEERTS